MADDSDNDLSAVAWPGFVDILSAVVIMFVFFVMIIAVALYFHTIIFKAKVMSESDMRIAADIADAQEQLTEASTTLEKKIEALNTEKQVLERVIADYKQEFYQAQAEFEESEEQKIVENRNKKEVLIFFGRDSISVTEEAKVKLTEIIASYVGQNGAKNLSVSIQASKNPAMKLEAVGRQLSLARMLNVRNIFLPTEIPTGQVYAKIINGEEIEQSYNWVRITFKNE